MNFIIHLTCSKAPRFFLSFKTYIYFAYASKLWNWLHMLLEITIMIKVMIIS